MGWFNEYPHKVYCSVLLVDGEIRDYKIGERYWESKFQTTLRGQVSYDEYNRAETKYTYWEVYNDKEHQEVFDVLAKQWMKQF